MAERNHKGAPPMPVVLLGLSHRTAPLEARERHAMPSHHIASALRALSDYSGVQEAAILSTCNRLEIYAHVDGYETGVVQIKEFLTTYRNMRVEEFDKYLYTMLGAEAVVQLLRVASGLDSMLIGEPQILAQVKDALRMAEAAGSIGPHLGRLFRVALQTGKRARTQTAIAKDVVSLGAAAVELAGHHCNISRSRCAVVGAGLMGATVARRLHARSPVSLTIVNRTPRRAQPLAGEVDARVAPLAGLQAVLRESDLVITAMAADRPVVTAAMVRASVAQAERSSPLSIIDIGVPRNVEPSTALLPGVVLSSIEDLRGVVDRSLQGRKSEIPAVESIVAEHTSAYLAWYRGRGAAPLIASLRHKAEQIRSAELEKLFARMPELDERQRAMVIAASVTIINRLLHAPVSKLRASLADAPGTDAAGLAEALLDFDAFSDRLQRQLDANLAARLDPNRK